MSAALGISVVPRILSELLRPRRMLRPSIPSGHRRLQLMQRLRLLAQDMRTLLQGLMTHLHSNMLRMMCRRLARVWGWVVIDMLPRTQVLDLD